MPRVRLANSTQIRSFASEVDAAQLEMNLTTTPCEDIGVARRKLEFFSAFRDKAFKAFYARKILQLPPVIAAQVFDVSNGLISQAATSRNVYTAANALNSSSMELGVFNLPDGSRVETSMNNEQRTRIFKAFTRMAIIKNRGVDVPNFQNRMVAGFMSESDADAFRASLPTMASVYANCPEVQEGATAEPAQADVNQGVRDSFRMETRRMLREVLGYNPTEATSILNALSDGLEIYGVTDNTDGTTIRIAVRSTNRVGASLDALRSRFNRVLGGISVSSPRVEMRSDGGYTVVIPVSTRQTGPPRGAIGTEGGAEEFKQRMASAGYTSVVARRFIEEIYNQGLEINSRNAVGSILPSSHRFSTTLQRQGGGTPDPQLMTRYRTAFRNVFESFGYDRMDVGVQETNTGMVSLRIPVGSNASQEAEEGTPTRTLAYMTTATSVQGMGEDNAAILALIAAGSDRDNAESLVTGLSSNNFNFTVRSRSGNVLSYRLQYFGNAVNAPQSFVIKQLIENRLRLQSSDVTMGERQGDLVGEITFPSTQAETSAPRRNIFTDPMLANRVTNWFNRHGYQDTYEAFYDFVSAVPTGQITVQDERPENLTFTIRRSDDGTVPARDLKSTLAGPRGESDHRPRYQLIDYTLNGMRTEARFRVLPFTRAQTATSTTTSPAQAAGNEQVEQLAREYGTVAAGPRIRQMFTREQYVQLRLAGYTYNQLRRFDSLLRQRNLAVASVQVKRTPRGAFRQFIQLNTRSGAGVPRAMRNQNYQTWLRGVLNSAEVQVSVNRDPNQGPYLQMAGFRRGSGTGYFILPSLVGDSIPLLSRTDRDEIARIQAEQTGTSQSGQASQEIDPQGDPGQAGESNPTSSTAPPTRTRTRNVKLNRSIGIEIEGDMPFAREAGMSITDYFKLRMRQWCEANDQPRLKVGRGMDKYTFGGDGSVSGAVPFEVDSPALVPANIDPATTTLPPDFIRANKFESDAALWNQIRTFCQSLQYSGVRVHKSAGLHIHISVADYTREDFERYVYNYASFEPLIDLAMAANSRGPGRAYSGSLVTAGRITTGWGRGSSVSRSTPEEAARSAMSIGRKKIRTSTGIQTIEFRHPMTTIDYDDIKNFTLLHFYLVTVSKRKKLQRTNFKGLMNILPIEVATYFYNRIETMDMKPVDYNFFTGTRGQDSALQKAGDTSEGVRQANLPREDYT